MVRTRPTGRGHEIVEDRPEACPDCGQRMVPKWTGCTSETTPGHRFWWCPSPEGCGLELIDAECDCDTPGRRWP
jgi:hypothetical protein